MLIRADFNWFRTEEPMPTYRYIPTTGYYSAIRRMNSNVHNTGKYHDVEGKKTDTKSMYSYM